MLSYEASMLEPCQQHANEVSRHERLLLVCLAEVINRAVVLRPAGVWQLSPALAGGGFLLLWQAAAAEPGHGGLLSRLSPQIPVTGASSEAREESQAAISLSQPPHLRAGRTLKLLWFQPRRPVSSKNRL